MPSGSDAVLRVLYLASTKSQGGIERHSVDLAEALREKGVAIQFACPPGSYVQAWCAERGIPTLPFRVRNSGDLEAVFRLARLVREQGIDVIHAHSRRDYVIVVLGAALARLRSSKRPRLILHAHMNRPLGSPAHLSGRFFAWGTDAVVAVSGTVADRLRHDHQFFPALVHLIYNGIPLDEYAAPGSPEAQARREEARQEWGVPSEALVLGVVGRLDAKGQAGLVGVLPGLVRRFPDLRLVLIGSEGEPGARAELDALASAGGVIDRLTYTGPREDVPRLLAGLDVLVHLPRDEAFGLALAEAMAAGLPTVATRIGGCREVVREGATGLLVEPGDGDALSEALGFLLDPTEGEARRAGMGLAGRHVAEAEFTRERQVALLLALYQELCASDFVQRPRLPPIGVEHSGSRASEEPGGGGPERQR